MLVYGYCSGIEVQYAPALTRGNTSGSRPWRALRMRSRGVYEKQLYLEYCVSNPTCGPLLTVEPVCSVAVCVGMQ